MTLSIAANSWSLSRIVLTAVQATIAVALRPLRP